jgi:hypothetical protein
VYSLTHRKFLKYSPSPLPLSLPLNYPTKLHPEAIHHTKAPYPHNTPYSISKLYTTLKPHDLTTHHTPALYLYCTKALYTSKTPYDTLELYTTLKLRTLSKHHTILRSYAQPRRAHPPTATTSSSASKCSCRTYKPTNATRSQRHPAHPSLSSSCLAAPT